MKQKIVIGSVLTAALVILVSFASVVGTQEKQVEVKKSNSPLFAIRSSRAIQKISPNGITKFLGKGTSTNLFTSQNMNKEMIQVAIQMISKNPALVQRLLQNIDQYPYLTKLLARYDITVPQIHQYLTLIKNNPTIVEQSITEVQFWFSEDDAQPLGLSTSNPLGCFIVAIVALIPITLVITLLVLLFTVRILTCLNVNDCANDIANNIWSQLTQGLTEP